MNDAIVTWKADPSKKVTGYNVTWAYNGVAQPPVAVPRTAQGDQSGYSLDFATSQPTITVGEGDTISPQVESVDSVNNRTSPEIASVPASITEPLVALAGPSNVVLTAS